MKQRLRPLLWSQARDAYRRGDAVLAVTLAIRAMRTPADAWVEEPVRTTWNHNGRKVDGVDA